MKKYFAIVFLLSLALTLSADELSWVDIQIEAIKPERKGISNSDISNVKSPFVFLNKTQKKIKTKPKIKTKKKVKSSSSNYKKRIVSKKRHRNFILSAVINKSALINGKWYKLNDRVYEYKLSDVKRTAVILTNDKIKIHLSTDAKRKLKFR